ncbi:hypothetical protein JMJ77_0006230, partial [Colletotrichum scovillei]
MVIAAPNFSLAGAVCRSKIWDDG